MKKLTFLPIVLLILAQTAFAGGILTNTNQSAQYVRMLSRNASTQIDAVYFNPAGVIKLEDGLHFGVHNQSIFQTRTITSEFPYLNNGTYKGKIDAPVFPDVFAAYKKDKIALSLMFGPVGGGGGAKYDSGLPSFEKDISMLVPGLAGLSQLGYSVSDYGIDLSFEGTSVFWGIQGGITYEVNDVFSVYGGVRYMPATNTYFGEMKNISLTVGGNVIGAQTFLNTVSGAASGLADQASAAATQFSGIATTLQNAISAGYVGANDPLADAQIIGALQQAGVDPTGFTNAIAVGALGQVSSTLSGQATELTTQAATLSATAGQLGDKEVDVKQKGSGISPIIGVNISPNENLNIGIKYEMKTSLTLTNETTIDQIGLFPDGQETSSDLPALLAIGVDYKFSDAFSAQLSYNQFFDKDVDWGKNVYMQDRLMDKNGMELALGLQYNISDNFAVSVGGLLSTTGASEQYQADFSFSNSSNTGAFGFEWKINDALTLDAGMLYTAYKDETKNFTIEGTTTSYQETYDKENIGFAIGLSYSIFSK